MLLKLIERMKTLDINVINGNSSGNIELIFKPVYSNLFRTKYDVLCHYKNEEMKNKYITEIPYSYQYKEAFDEQWHRYVWIYSLASE